MTAAQHAKVRSGLTWNLVQWIKLKQWARRNGQADTQHNAQCWIDDCRQRIKRLNEMEQL